MKPIFRLILSGISLFFLAEAHCQSNMVSIKGGSYIPLYGRDSLKVTITDFQMDVPIDDIELSPSEDDPKEIGREALQRMIDLITTDATISIEEKSNRFCFNVKGGNSAVLIGKRGQTLEAMQYIVEKIVNKKRKERVGIQVDVEGYLEKRRISLEKTAFRLAEKVKRTGKPATIGQMNSHDRRIVHIALKDDDMVRTQSMGDGILRKLVIFPKKNSSRKKNH